MQRLKQIFFTPFPNEPLKTISKWANGAVIPSVIMIAGSSRVMQIAQTPFEQYLGITVTAILALGWTAVFFCLLPKSAI